jgi:hypothetical protein
MIAGPGPLAGLAGRVTRRPGPGAHPRARDEVTELAWLTEGLSEAQATGIPGPYPGCGKCQALVGIGSA